MRCGDHHFFENGNDKISQVRKGHVEIPSDLSEDIYTVMDPEEGCQLKLVEERKADKLKLDVDRLWE
jgi:hypothetical protein